MKAALVANTYIPLRFMVLFGCLISILFGLFGIFGAIDRYVKPGIFGVNLYLSGTAVLAMLIIFLVGVIITCIGFIGIYIEHIHTEILNRPIFAIKRTILWVAFRYKLVAVGYLLLSWSRLVWRRMTIKLMRILILNWKDINNPNAGGAELVIHELAKRMVLDKHEVTLLTSAFKNSLQNEGRALSIRRNDPQL